MYYNTCKQSEGPSLSTIPWQKDTSRYSIRIHVHQFQHQCTARLLFGTRNSITLSQTVTFFATAQTKVKPLFTHVLLQLKFSTTPLSQLLKKKLPSRDLQLEFSLYIALGVFSRLSNQSQEASYYLTSDLHSIQCNQQCCLHSVSKWRTQDGNLILTFISKNCQTNKSYNKRELQVKKIYNNGSQQNSSQMRKREFFCMRKIFSEEMKYFEFKVTSSRNILQNRSVTRTYYKVKILK